MLRLGYSKYIKMFHRKVAGYGAKPNMSAPSEIDQTRKNFVTKSQLDELTGSK